MPRLPDHADLEALRAFDTPTICNALELVAPARRAVGFTRRPLFAAFPEMKPVVAFARTAIIRSREPHPRGREEAKEVRLGYYQHIADEPLPSIAVIQDIDAPDTGFGAFWGEVQTHVHKGLGCAGVITDGGADLAAAENVTSRKTCPWREQGAGLPPRYRRECRDPDGQPQPSFLRKPGIQEPPGFQQLSPVQARGKLWTPALRWGMHTL